MNTTKYKLLYDSEHHTLSCSPLKLPLPRILGVQFLIVGLELGQEFKTKRK